ncbi:HpcH/HpaI aldolase family protein [Sporolituus thermophilus]|uniref:4-hydroxy-2-oxoheptanedioate aldolase n=1 Tax=Sporolituus thermophilus DSM 23256 TaxID=1123285 RepID=A0A1G7PLK7_9FIRM|nr:aldolase/citrate lyase family protein [Sporolituus thermophilus]SDF86529.1 4-hydroxy-2-oxoheptanedioate aldolase [Sporolituus thermophilus DSM 23256]
MSRPSFPVNRLKTKLAAGQPVAGSFLFTGEPALVEIMGYAGLDFVVIDTEHTPNDSLQVQHLVRAAELAGITPVVRVLANCSACILRALDVGAQALLIPQINSAAEAEAAVRAAKYGPQGERGMAGIVRAARYGFVPLGEYIQAANENTMVIVQVESMAAVHNLDAILTVDGVDAVFIGPADLSQSMGLTGQFENSEFRRTVHDVIDRAKAAGVRVGIFCAKAAEARYWREAGADMLAVGTDTMLFAAAVRDLVKDLG